MFISSVAPFGRASSESVSNVPAVVHVTDDATITVWSSEAESLCGLRAAEVLGRPLDSFLELTDGASLRQKLETGRSGRHTAICRRDDGHSARINLVTTPVRDDTGATIAASIVLWAAEEKAPEACVHQLNRELRAISHCQAAVLRATDETAMLHAVCRVICDEVGYQLVWIGYAEHDAKRTVRPVAWAGNENGFFDATDITWADTPLGHGPTGTAIRAGRPVVVDDFVTDSSVAPWRAAAQERGYRSALALPLKDERSKVTGALSIYSTTPRAFTAEETRLLGELADSLAFGIAALRVRQALHDAHERLAANGVELRRIADAAPGMMGTFHLRPDGKVCMPYVSPQIQQLFGLTPAEVKYDAAPLLARTHPEDAARVNAAIAESARTMTPWHQEYRVIHPSRGEIWVEGLTSPYARPDDGIVWYGFVWEVTARKQAERLLWDSERLHRALAENSPDVIIRYDRQCRRVFFNRAFLEFSGLGREETRDRTPLTGSPLLAPEAYIGIIRDCLRTGTQREVVLSSRRFDGESRWGLIRFVPELDAAGRVETVLVIGRDVHELKIAEQRLQTLIDHHPDGVVRYNHRGCLTYASPAAQRLLGLIEPEMIGRTVDALFVCVSDPERAQLAEAVQNVFARSEAADCELCWAEEDGERCFEIRHVPETDAAGRTTGVLGIIRDITEQRQREQAQQRQLRFEEGLNRVNRAIQTATGETELMRDVLDCVLAIFSCERAFLVYPCDPTTPTWSVPMERHLPDYPGVMALQLGDIPSDEQICQTFERLLASGTPQQWGPDADVPVPTAIERKFSVRSFMAMALKTKCGRAWQFGIHQCTHAQRWSTEDEALFAEIGKRLQDALNALLTQRTLIENEARLRQAHRIARLGSWELNPADGAMAWTDGYAQILGLEVRASMPGGEHLCAHIHPDDRERVCSACRDAVRQVSPYSIEYRFLLPDGNIRHVHAEAEPRKAVDGSVHFVGTVQDITAHKTANETLVLFRALVENANDGIEVVDPETGRFLDINARACAMHGYTRDEYLALSIGDIDELAHDEPWSVACARFRAAGNTTTVSRHRRKNGTTFPVEVNIAYVRLERDYVVSIVRDITRRREAEEALRESERRFRQVSDNITEVFWLSTATFDRFFYVNTAFATVWGVSPETLYANPHSWLDAVHPEDRDRVQESLDRASGYALDLQCRIQRPDGHVRWVHLRTFPIADETGRSAQLAGVAADITERLDTESQLRHAQKMEELGRFAGGIAHDFNNLLAAIQLQTSALLCEEFLPSTAREGVQTVQLVAERAATLTRQILLFSRRSVANPQPLDLGTVLRGVIKWLQRVLGEDIAVELHCPSDMPQITADMGMIEQVFVNLATNARDAMPGGGRLTIRLSCGEVMSSTAAEAQPLVPGRYVHWEISDTGSGIAPEVLPRIFDPYFTTKEAGRGTGLGLATVYGIIQQHQGRIEVHSTPGTGTTFRIALPARPTTDAAKAAPETTIAAPAETQGRILVVDDDDIVRQLVGATLRRRHYDVTEAADGPAALAIANEANRPIDLVITDVMMSGGISGPNLIARLRASRENLKVIYISGYLRDVALQPHQLAPGESFLNKPFSIADLAAIVHRQLTTPSAPGATTPLSTENFLKK